MLKAIHSDEFSREEERMFGLTCCGASINISQKYSIIGDFEGFVRLFNNE